MYKLEEGILVYLQFLNHLTTIIEYNIIIPIVTPKLYKEHLIIAFISRKSQINSNIRPIHRSYTL